MQSEELKFKVITPIFSYGHKARDNNAEPEIRSSSIKGMMRYMFRIIQPDFDHDPRESTRELRALENELFGDAEVRSSPVKLALISKIEEKDFDEQPFLLHKKKRNEVKNKKIGINPGVIFKLRIMTRHKAPKSLDWYNNLIQLTFILIGLGQRSRKGRGRIVYLSEILPAKIPAKAMKKLIEGWLNQICLNKGGYKLEGDKITPQHYSKSKRPVIQKIEFGEITSDWDKFLAKVDEASHEVKKQEHDYAQSLRGKDYYATGSAGIKSKGTGRFSSSVIVGMAETTEGYLPIYTYLKPVVRSQLLNPEKSKEELKMFRNTIDRVSIGGNVK